MLRRVSGVARACVCVVGESCPKHTPRAAPPPRVSFLCAHTPNTVPPHHSLSTHTFFSLRLHAKHAFLGQAEGRGAQASNTRVLSTRLALCGHNAPPSLFLFLCATFHIFARRTNLFVRESERSLFGFFHTGGWPFGFCCVCVLVFAVCVFFRGSSRALATSTLPFLLPPSPCLPHTLKPHSTCRLSPAPSASSTWTATRAPPGELEARRKQFFFARVEFSRSPPICHPLPPLAAPQPPPQPARHCRAVYLVAAGRAERQGQAGGRHVAAKKWAGKGLGEPFHSGRRRPRSRPPHPPHPRSAHACACRRVTGGGGGRAGGGGAAAGRRVGARADRDGRVLGVGETRCPLALATPASLRLLLRTQTEWGASAAMSGGGEGKGCGETETHGGCREQGGRRGWLDSTRSPRRVRCSLSLP